MVGEIRLGAAAERAIGDAEVTPAERVVHYLANFYDAARISTVRAVDADAEKDVVVLQPRGVFGTADLRIVGGGNAVAGNVGRVVGAVVDLHAAPGDVAPVDVAFDENFFPARHDTGKDRPLDPQIVLWRGDIPCHK